jgi:putative ABC transport system permease protein
MTILEAIVMAIKDIMRAKMRSFLTMLGVIIGIFAVISLVNIGEGMKGFMYEQIMGFGTGPTYMEVHAGKKGEMFGSMAAAAITYQDARAIAEECPSVELVDPRLLRPAEFTYRNKTYSVPMLSGSTQALIEMMNWGVDEGRFISEVDVEMRRKVCVLGKRIVKNLFGEFSPVGEKIRINGSNFVVIGVLQEKGAMMGFDLDEYAVIPVTTAIDLFKLKKLIEIGVVAKSEDLVEKAVSEIHAVLLKRHGQEDFRIDTMEESIAMLDTVMNALTGIVTGIAAISLLVGGIGIANIMLVAVTERIREIGIRKAVGAKKRDILVQFLIEAVIISLMGGVLGIIFGVGVSSIVMYFIGLPLTITPWSIFMATLVSILVGVVSGVYPATRAAKLDPVEALRYE